MKILLIVLACAALLFFALLGGMFLLVFYAPRGKKKPKEEYPIPAGKIYEPHRAVMTRWMKETRALPHEEACITSFDGLKLYASYYENEPGAVIELMFHGYRGNAERDLCGGVQRAFALGRSAFVVDQRTAGRSEGRVITFGIRERRDCLAWVDYLVERFGPEVKIILTGISMGAATVLMASGMDLPEQVVGVIADCGYTSPKEIISAVMGRLKLPAKLLYPPVRLAARLFGGFDIEEASALESVKGCRVPVFFAHGEADDFVPCEMSRVNYEACPTPKKLLTVPGAGHGLAYVLAPEAYLAALREIHK